MTGFVQIIEYKTSRPDDVRQLGEDYQAKREADASGPTPISSVTTEDRDRPGTFLHIVEFASYDEAMENSARADTSEFSQQMMALFDGAPRFYNLDITRQWTH